LNPSNTNEFGFDGWTVLKKSSIAELSPCVEEAPKMREEYRAFISEISILISQLHNQLNLLKEKKLEIILDHFFKLLKKVSANIDLYKKGELLKSILAASKDTESLLTISNHSFLC